MEKLIFSIMSYDTSEILVISWFGAHKTFLVIISDEKSCTKFYLTTF